MADAYRFRGFRTLQTVQGLFGDPQARLITLVRRGKKQSAGPAVQCTSAGTTAGAGEHAICRVGTTAFTWIWKFAGFTVGAVAP